MKMDSNTITIITAVITALVGPILLLVITRLFDHIKEKQGKKITPEQLNESVKEIKQSVESVKEDIDGVNNRLQQHMNEHQESVKNIKDELSEKVYDVHKEVDVVSSNLDKHMEQHLDNVKILDDNINDMQNKMNIHMEKMQEEMRAHMIGDCANNIRIFYKEYMNADDRKTIHSETEWKMIQQMYKRYKQYGGNGEIQKMFEEMMQDHFGDKWHSIYLYNTEDI